MELGNCGGGCGAGACGVSYGSWKFYNDEMIVWLVVKGGVNEWYASLRSLYDGSECSSSMVNLRMMFV